MGDVYCRRCREPWDYLAVREDFSKIEQELFWKGIACPSCISKDDNEIEEKMDILEWGMAIMDSTDIDPQELIY